MGDSMSEGFVKSAKIEFPAKHQALLEIYREICNQPNATTYTIAQNDINPNDCWFKVEEPVSKDERFTDNLKTYQQAIEEGLQVNEE